MPRWQKLLRHNALIHRYKEAVRNAMLYACPRVTGLNRSADRSPAGMEPLEPRLLLSGSSISGNVYADLDGDGTQDANESAIDLSGHDATWGVYLDLNQDGSFNGSDVKVTPDDDGNYSFLGLAADTYDVRVKLPFAWSTTDPSSGLQSITLAVDQQAQGVDFGVTPLLALSANAQSGPAVIEGTVPVSLGLLAFGIDIEEWSIDWGDGGGSGPLDATTASQLHTYAAGVDTYTTTASIIDMVTQLSFTRQISVDVLNSAPNITLSGSSTSALGGVYQLEVSATDPGVFDTIVQWQVDWGDGSSVQYTPASNAGNTDSITLTHQYTAAGDHPIVVRAQDSDGDWTGVGDLDGDGFIGIDDLNIVLGNWNQNVPPADTRADPSGDGFVGIEDLNFVLGNWNKTSGSFNKTVTVSDQGGVTYVVSTAADELDLSSDPLAYSPGGLSLREALALATNHVNLTGTDTITFDTSIFGPTHTIGLDLGELVIDSDVVIQGLGADRLTIDAQNQSRVFKIESGVDATIYGLTITGGLSPSTSQGGGGIFSEGDLTLQSSHVTGNHTGGVGGAGVTGGGYGSGIHQAGGMIEITDSTISDNAGAIFGGGLYVLETDSIVISNSTISGNYAQVVGGGITIIGDSADPTTATLTNVTITDNSTGTIINDIPTGIGGGFALGDYVTATINNSIIAGNSNIADPATDDVAIAGTVASANNNLIGFDPATGNGFDKNDAYGNLVGGEGTDPAFDPVLAPLGDYGGPTPTHALLAGSPAIDAGDNTSASGLSNDQRGAGFTREVAGAVDIGAFEHDARIWIEAENYTSLTTASGHVGFQVVGDPSASGYRVLTVPGASGITDDTGSTPAEYSVAGYSFDLDTAGDYYFWGRTIATHTGADAFWVKLDSGGWVKWNEIPLTLSGGSPQVPVWGWDDLHDNTGLGNNTPITFTSLSAGTHTLYIGFSEDGTQLDKMLLTNNASLVPTGLGGIDLTMPDIRSAQLTATVRDFHSYSGFTDTENTKKHQDFQNYTVPSIISDETNYYATGLVQDVLGADGNPIFSSSYGTSSLPEVGPDQQITGPLTFAQWFEDDPFYNRSMDVTIHMLEDLNRPGVFQFVGSSATNGSITTTSATNEFFPIDGLLFNENDADPEYEAGYSDHPNNDDEYAEDHNFHFTMELHAEFTYRSGQTLNVIESDDDLWIYVDNQLLVDLGGIHAPLAGEFDLELLNLVEGHTYSFDLFFAERKTDQSNLVFETTIDDLRTRNTAPYFTSDPYQDEISQTRVIDTLVDNAPVPHHLEMVADGRNELLYPLAGLDPEGDDISFSIVQGPKGIGTNDMWIDTSGGAPVLRWKPASLGGSNTVTHQVRLRVTDEHGLYSPNNDQLFRITLLPPVANFPPEFDYVPQVDVELAAGLNDQAHAIDPDNLPEELTYTGHLVALPADESLNDALSGYWNFDNSLADGGVFNNPVTATGAALQPYVGINGALTFNGVNNYAYADSAIDPGANSFTVAAWVRLDRLPASGNMVLIGQADGSNPANWLYVDSTGILKSDLGSSTAVSADPLTPEAWHHVAITYDLGTETLKLYVDGGLVDTETSVVAGSADGQIIFGKDADDPSGYLDGTLDDVRIYKFVRDDFDIYKLAKPYAASPPPVVGIKDLHDFNGGSDSLSEDSQGIDPAQQSFSLSTWVRLDQLPASGNMVLIGQADESNPANWLYVDSGGILKSDLGGTATVESSTALRAGVWYHAVLTYDHDSGTLKLYLDSAQQDANTSVTPASASGQFVIGKDADSTTSYLDGSLRDIRIHQFVFDSSEIGVLAESYEPEFSVSETGEITWQPPAGLSGKRVTLDMRVEDPAGLYDIYNYQVNITGALPDLAVDVVDPFTAQFDPQALTIAGTVKAKISNLGTVAVTDPFNVLFFEDIDFNQVYTPGVDNLLGTTIHNARLKPGQTAWVAADLDGDVQYAGALIWAWADSGETIVEIEEANNILRSHNDCEMAPAISEFDIELEKYLTDGSLGAGVMMTPIVADIDKETGGIPEIIVVTLDGKLVVADPLTGDVIASVYPDANLDPLNQLAVGQLDDDPQLEIIILGQNYIAAYDYDPINTLLVSKWKTSQPDYPTSPEVFWGAPALVDFDHDGNVEIVVSRYVYRGADGTLIADGSNTLGVGKGFNQWGPHYGNQNVGPISTIADLDLDGVPEIVAGNSAYTFNGQSMSLMWNQSGVTNINDGFTAVANFDEDPNPEIVLVSQGYVSVLEHDGSLKYGPIALPGGGAGGTPTIGNFDGVDGLEIGVAGASAYTAFYINSSNLLDILWSEATQDISSEVTGSSLFDFNGDGKVEVIYSDEVNLWIFDGATGNDLPNTPILVGTNTGTELPVIADVDADGHAEIVVSTNTSSGGSNSGIMIFGGPGGSWVPTREIWNQHSYHITNVNDDGTIPAYEERSWLTHNTYRLNTFSDPSINPLAVPDLIPSYLRIEDIGGGDTKYTIRVGNSGSATVAAGVNVVFYNTVTGEPVQFDDAGDGSVVQTQNALAPGQWEDVVFITSDAAVTSDFVMVIVDDDGEGVGAVLECNELNNFYPMVPTAQVTSPPTRYGKAGAAYSYTVEASDVLVDQMTMDPLEKRIFQLVKRPVGTETEMTIDPDTGVITWTPGDRDDGVYPVQVMVRYTDINNGSKLTRFAVQSYDLRISERANTRPVIIGTSNENLATDGTYTITIEASDAENDTLTFSADPTRGSVDFVVQPDGVTAVMTWTPGEGITGGFTLSVEVADDFGKSTIKDIYIPAINYKPIFITESLDPAVAGEDYYFRVVAVDPENRVDLQGQGVTYAKWSGQWGDNDNIYLDTNTGLITTDPSLAEGNYTFTIEAKDADLNTETHEYTLYVDPAPSSNTPPTIDVEPRSEVGVRQWFVYRVEVSDADGDHVAVVDAKITLAGEETALTAVQYDETTRVLYWRPSDDDLGDYDVIIKVSDGVNAPVTETYSLKVVPETSGSAPEIVDKDYPSAKVGQPYRIKLEATDADNDPVWWYITDKPDVLMVIDSETGEFLWTPQEAHRPSQDVYIRAIDATGMSSSIKLTIPVRSANTPPRIRSITPVPGEGFKYLVKAEDIDGEDLTITIGPDSDFQIGDQDVSFEQIDTTTAVLTFDGELDPDTYHLQFEVTDGSGTSDIKGLGITVSSGGGSFSPTSISPDPGYFAMPGVSYVYSFQVTDQDDPNSENTVVTLLTKPTGMSDPVQDPNDASLWTITWTPTVAQAGTGNAQYHEVVISIDDGTGAKTTYSYDIGVRANHRPAIEAGRTIDVYSDQRFTYPVRVQDQDNDLILYELKQTDGSPIPDTWGLSIDEYGRITWENADENRTFVVRAADTFPASYEDPTGSWVESTFMFNVLTDMVDPTITISGASGQTNPGSVIHLQLHPVDNESGVAQVTLEVTYDSQTESVPVGLDYIASFRVPDGAEPGDVFTFTAKVWDNAGRTGTSSPYNRTLFEPDGNAPIVQLVSPSIDASKGLISIRTATELIGKVYDGIDTLEHYKVELLPVSGGSAITVKEMGTVDSEVSIENVGSAVTNGVIAVVDPTLIADGTYQIVISARDVTDSFVTMCLDYVQIESQIKVGNFNVSFTDLSIPIAGQNIRVVRTYDSLLSGTEGDFGYGWTADILTGKLEVTGLGDATSDIDLGLLETLNFTAAYQQGTRITLTLPNGREYGFTATPILRDDFGAGYAWLAGGLGGVLHFQPDPGQNAVLDFGPGNTRVFDDIIQNGELIYEGYRSVDILFDEDTGQFRTGGSGGLPVSPQNLGVKEFRLRDVDGSTYFFDVNTGQLLRSEDPFGNVTKYTSNGDITVEDNQSNPLATITIERDVKGRIIEITAPDESTISYTYDSETDDLATFTNFAGETVTFNYGEGGMPNHYLTSIEQGNDTILEVVFEQDPIGSNSYRVKSISDASGADANFGYELDLSDYTLPNDGYTAETVTDGGKYTSNTVLRNERGNTARQIRNIYDSLGNDVVSYLITLFGYYDPTNPDLLTHQSQPFSLTAGGSDDPFTYLPSDFTWASISQYDDKGRLTHTINGVLNSDAFEGVDDPDEDIWNGPTVTEYRDFDRFGNPHTILTPGGGQTSNSYNDKGQLGSTTQTFINADGVTRTSTTNYDYSPQGNLNTVTQVNDKGEAIVLSSFVYDALGRLIKSTDSNDRSRYFAYDLNGNQTHSWQVWQNDPTSPTAFKTLVTATEYDLQGRVKGTAQFVFNDNVVTDHDDNGDNGAAYLKQIDKAPNDTDEWTDGTPPAALQSYSLTEYNSRGLVTMTTDQFGSVSYTFYDKRGLVVETASQTKKQDGSPAWMVSRTIYDTLGRATHSIDPYIVTDAGNPSVYDERPTSINTFGSITVYDRHGRVEESQRVSNLTIDVTASGSWYTSVLGGTTPTVITKSQTLFDDSGRVLATINHNDPTISTDDARTDYYYDTTGRQIGVLGPVVKVAGANVRTLSVTLYDTAGRQEQSVTGYAILNTVTDFATHPDLFPSADTLDTNTVDTARTQLRTTAFTYDDLGRVDTTTQLGDTNTDADDVVTKTVFDSQGRRVVEIDPLGRRTDYQYDDTGRLISVTLPQIDPHAQATGKFDARRPKYEYTYDIYGNQTAITDPIGTSTTTAGDRQTDFTYDHLGRQTSRTLPEGQTETMHYDDTPIVTVQGDLNPDDSVGGGQLAYSVDFEGNVTAYLYDNTATGRGRLISKTYYDADEVTGTIAVDESLATLAARLGDPARTVEYTYDAFGRVLITHIDNDPTDPGTDTHTTTNTYDTQGWLTQVESAEGFINYRYDDLGQLVRTWTGDTTASDDAGSPTTETIYAYDNLGRLTSVDLITRNGSATSNEEVTYAYDVNGAQDYEYNEATGVTKDITYDELGRAEVLTHFIDLNDDHEYNAGSENLVARFTYTYDAAGNRTSALEEFNQDAATKNVIDQTQKFTWKYDGLNRLTVETFDKDNDAAADTEDYVTRYTFDLASNRKLVKKMTGSHDNTTFSADETIEYTYDENDRIETEIKIDHNNSANDRNTRYVYDGTVQTTNTVRLGSTIDAGALDEIVLSTYDATGRMTSITVVKGGTTTVTDYEYNDAGLRVKATETVDAGTPVVTVYHFDNNNHTGYAQTLEEKDGTGTVTKTFTLGHDVIAQAAPAILAGELLAFLYDLHDSTRALVDTTGNFAVSDPGNNSPTTTTDDVVQAFTYDAYGNFVDTAFGAKTQADALASLLYSGEFTSAATGQQYLRARFYDPTTGRFNRLDPFAGNTSDPLSLHKYLYAHGNPVMGIDPSGLTNAMELNAVTGGIITITGLLFAKVFQQAISTAHANVDIIDAIQVLLSSGVEAVQDAAALLVSQAEKVKDAIKDAIRAAQQLGKDLNTLLKMPKFIVLESLMPKIYSFNTRMLIRRPDWLLLVYNGPKSPLTTQNRTWVQTTYAHIRISAPPNTTMDEFPFASTFQGGARGPARAVMVPAKENLIQGGYLSVFYRYRMKGKPGFFLVVPVPI